jgi:hypothetical protein
VSAETTQERVIKYGGIPIPDDIHDKELAELELLSLEQERARVHTATVTFDPEHKGTVTVAAGTEEMTGYGYCTRARGTLTRAAANNLRLALNQWYYETVDSK